MRKHIWAGIALLGTCLTLASFTSPIVFAHGNADHVVTNPGPYLGGMGDPAGLTSTRYSDVAPTTVPGLFAPVTPHHTYVPYIGAGDPNGLTSTIYRQSMASHIVRSRRAHAHSGHHEAVDNPLANQIRDLNARFADVNVAVAEGYSPIPCVSGVEGGAMGIHYVNGDLIKDPAIDIAKPEAVMYEPKADGTMQLVAVEYITHQGPAALGGQLFAFNGAPNRYGLDPFYELHVWAWRDNPTGTFADMNPNVSCAAAGAKAE